MRLSKLIFFTFFLLTAVSAKAQFFSFYLSGADEERANFFYYYADVCVPTTAVVGDITTSPNGNQEKIISIDGPSQECANAAPAQSIRAKKSFHFLPSEKAGLTIPDEFIPKTLSYIHRSNGNVLDARSSDNRKFVQVMIINNHTAKDFLRKMEQIFSNSTSFGNGHVVKSEEFNFNGMQGYRSIVNTTEISSSLPITLLITTYSYKDKTIYILIGLPSNQFESFRAVYTQIPLSLTGLRGDGPISPSKSSPAIDQFKQQCKDLGFKPGTEKFGNCVLELNK